MPKRIIWSPLAERNLEEVLSYWTKRNQSSSYSLKLSNLLFDSVELLSQYPMLRKSTNLERVRLKVVRDFYIVYEVHENEIQIHAIWDTRQNPIKLSKLLRSLT